MTERIKSIFVCGKQNWFLPGYDLVEQVEWVADSEMNADKAAEMYSNLRRKAAKINAVLIFEQVAKVLTIAMIRSAVYPLRQNQIGILSSHSRGLLNGRTQYTPEGILWLDGTQTIF